MEVGIACLKVILGIWLKGWLKPLKLSIGISDTVAKAWGQQMKEDILGKIFSQQKQWVIHASVNILKALNHCIIIVLVDRKFEDSVWK